MLSIKPNHKTIKDYYLALETFSRIGITHETAVRNAFQSLLVTCCRQMRWDFIEEFHFKRPGRNPASVDGAMFDQFKVPQGYWEAKDTQDDLKKEISKKFTEGYPRDNIIFQQPERAIVWQGNYQVCDEDITNPTILVQVLKLLFSYKTDIQTDWEVAVEEFKNRIPESAELVIKLIENERKVNKRFIDSFNTFADLCRASINPNIADPAIEEMLVQHLLTERIFRKVFDNSDFANRNIIASEIEKVIQALTSMSYSRQEFLKPLDRFYVSLEKRALAIDDFSQKQAFLNTVYEKFFQGFAVKVADTHGIVYTPQPIVEFMVDSVEEILKREFGKSLSSPNVHILDPFTGTGSFVVHTLHKINKTDLKNKFMNELHCNEIMLLPYYIATMNIEHEYYSLTGDYEPFPGICLVDTFQLAEQAQASMFSEENTQRVQKLKETPIFVFISNPPYNAGQVNENDNNKNRKYPVIDKRVSDTYEKDSKATLTISSKDPYIKSFRWASDHILKKGEGIIAFVSNNSFLDGFAHDGMRKHLYEKFDEIYIINLKGNVRQNPKISGTTHNVFGIQVGVSINILIKYKDCKTDKCKIFYSEVDDFERKEIRLKFLEKNGHIYNIDWKEITPDKNNNWLTEGMQEDFENYIPVGTKESKAGTENNAIFKIYSNGIKTNRDSWVYNSSKIDLENNVKSMIEIYNEHVIKYQLQNPKPNIDDFVDNDDTKISWSGDLKFAVMKSKIGNYKSDKIFKSIYRPYFSEYLYFDRLFNNSVYQFPKIFPTIETEKENLVICCNGSASEKPFTPIVANLIVNLAFLGGGTSYQCFPFYTYNEDGTNRRENITDWALQEYQAHYKDNKITKWDIFYYIYAVLHKPEYRTKYAANLRRELPRIPFYEDFWKHSDAGKKLSELHVNYESQPEYPLTKIEAPGKQLDYKVEKMKLSKDKQTLIYNDFLSLTGIPFDAFDYKLGNRSALEWLIDQYQIKTDKRSGIVNDPNRPDEPDYIVKLIGKIITVSLETVKIVREL